MRYQYLRNPAAQQTIVFLHGWCCKPDDFRFQVDYFKQNYSLLMPNYSDLVINAKAGPESWFQYCAAALQDCIEEAQLQDFYLIGHSMGGVMALRLAELMQNQQRGCVIIDTTLPLPPTSKALAFVEALDKPKGLNLLRQTINQAMINHQYDDQVVMVQVEAGMSAIWRKAPKAFSKLLKEAMQYDKLIALQNLSSKVLYIGGTPSRGDEQAMQQANPNVQFEQLRAGHFVMLNAPDATNVLLDKFFSKNASS